MSKIPIEFRAWDKIDKKMRRVAGIYFSQGRGQVTMEGMKSRRFHNIDLMRFTGLFDKNGTKIFEGDIIRTDDSVLSDEVVVYDDAQYPALLWAGDQGVKESNRIKVIGNIHENPELLK